MRSEVVELTDCVIESILVSGGGDVTRSVSLEGEALLLLSWDEIFCRVLKTPSEIKLITWSLFNVSSNVNAPVLRNALCAERKWSLKLSHVLSLGALSFHLLRAVLKMCVF